MSVGSTKLEMARRMAMSDRRECVIIEVQIIGTVL